MASTYGDIMASTYKEILIGFKPGIRLPLELFENSHSKQKVDDSNKSIWSVHTENINSVRKVPNCEIIKITGATSYGIFDSNTAWIEKNGRRSFFNTNEILFIGSAFDLLNEEN